MRLFGLQFSIICAPQLLRISSSVVRSFSSRRLSSSFFALRSSDYSTMSEHIVKFDDLYWVDLHIAPNQMLPENTLNMGQCFCWKPLQLRQASSEKYWVGVVEEVPILLRQMPHTTEAAFLFSNLQIERKEMSSNKFHDTNNLKSLLQSYFQVEDDLPTLYGEWSQCCKRMEIVAQCLQGVRVVRQNPWECLVSFICSSNNNISRITLMLDRLRTQFGRYLCSVDVSQTGDLIIGINDRKSSLIPREMEHHLYTFPSVASLASLDEQTLRDLGMGYRAKFIVESAKLVQSKSREMLSTSPNMYLHDKDVKDNTKDDMDDLWLRTLRQYAAQPHLSEEEKRRHVQEQLLLLPGVGRKVADCVALFSLDQSEAIPVDTHVWSIAIRDYAPHLRMQVKSLTPTVYDEVGNVFRNLFQHRAGWAHSVLFAAELPNFRNLLPTALQEEMKEFIVQQKQGKIAKKDSSVPKKQKEAMIPSSEENDIDIPRNAKNKNKKRGLETETSQINYSTIAVKNDKQGSKKSRV